MSSVENRGSAIVPELLLAYKFPLFVAEFQSTQTHSERNVAIYALGIGACLWMQMSSTNRGKKGRSEMNPAGNKEEGERTTETKPMPQAPAPSMAGVIIQDQGSRSQPDMMGLMTQVLDTPAFSGILSEIAGQTGVGSVDDLRGMFQHLSQNAETRNTINQLAQQVTTEDVSSIFARPGGGQGGAMDFSSMYQQMMPILSRDAQIEPSSITQMPEVDIQEAVQRIIKGSTPQDIFRAVLQASLLHGEAGSEELVDDLCANDDLANEFMEALSHDLQGRLQSSSS